jgi:DNA-binding MarR family transcriptional regulator
MSLLQLLSIKCQIIGMKADMKKDIPPSSATPISLGPLDQRLGYALRRAQMAVFADFFDAFKADDIKPAQYSVLTVIANNVGLTQTQVAETLGIQKPNFVTMIRHLEKRGLVKRSATLNDKRSNILSLSNEGQTLLKRLEIIADDHENKIKDHIGESSYEALFGPLLKLGKIDLP